MGLSAPGFAKHEEARRSTPPNSGSCSYRLPVRLRLLSTPSRSDADTPPLGDAVAFGYICGDFTWHGPPCRQDGLDGFTAWPGLSRPPTSLISSLRCRRGCPQQVHNKCGHDKSNITTIGITRRLCAGTLVVSGSAQPQRSTQARRGIFKREGCAPRLGDFSDNCESKPGAGTARVEPAAAGECSISRRPPQTKAGRTSACPLLPNPPLNPKFVAK